MSGLGTILVLGLGRSGQAVARYAAGLLAEGKALSVTVVDSADTDELRKTAEEVRSLGVEVMLGVQEVEGGYDICIASPGIPPRAPLMISARAASRRTISEIEFAFQQSDRPWIAVTGTNGKTTTTALVAHLLHAGGIDARAVGNIGVVAVAEATAGDRDVLVAEVSSFQLALSETFHPRVAVLLNVAPDHVDWHGSLEAYAADKARVFENLTSEDVAVIDVDDAGSAPYADLVEAHGIPVIRVSLTARHAAGATVMEGVLTLETHGGPIRLVRADDLLIRGDHNVSNALAAAAAAHAFGVTPRDIQSGLRSFLPIEHRLEPVGIIDGAEWVNDSKATNPDAALRGVTAFADRPLIVLLGGRATEGDYRPLAEEVADRARAAIVFGEARMELASAFSDSDTEVLEAVTMSDAVEAARAMARPGDVVLLSPACKSFDEFTSYEHRGQVFKELVAGMAGENV